MQIPVWPRIVRGSLGPCAGPAGSQSCAGTCSRHVPCRNSKCQTQIEKSSPKKEGANLFILQRTRSHFLPPMSGRSPVNWSSECGFSSGHVFQCHTSAKNGGTGAHPGWTFSKSMPFWKGEANGTIKYRFGAIQL